MDEDGRPAANDPLVQAASVWAAALYLLLNRLPGTTCTLHSGNLMYRYLPFSYPYVGSIAFNVFQPMMFRRSVGLLQKLSLRAGMRACILIIVVPMARPNALH